jgi:hypothetical protein
MFNLLKVLQKEDLNGTKKIKEFGMGFLRAYINHKIKM